MSSIPLDGSTPWHGIYPVTRYLFYPTFQCSHLSIGLMAAQLTPVARVRRLSCSILPHTHTHTHTHRSSAIWTSWLVGCGLRLFCRKRVGHTPPHHHHPPQNVPKLTPPPASPPPHPTPLHPTHPHIPIPHRTYHPTPPYSNTHQRYSISHTSHPFPAPFPRQPPHASAAMPKQLC